MSAEKKLWFCGRGPCDSPGAWASLWDEAELRDFFKTDKLVTAHLPKKFSTLRVESHHALDEGDTRVYIWGEKQPGFQNDDYGQHKGIKIEVDGKVVYNDLKPAGDADDLADHDPECEDCAPKPVPRPKKNGRAKKR